MQSLDGDLEQQDSRGWTPIMWSSSNGYCKLVKQLVQRGADVHHIGQARGGSGTTTALHECAAMRGEKNQPAEGYYETAWLLMAVGASPFTERSDGLTPLEVAASHGNVQMKSFLEGCCLFRGTLAMPVPQAFGSKVKSRYCTVQPRFPLGNAAPTLWMICYRNTNEAQAVCKIPLGNARVMVEGSQDSDHGIIIVPSGSKVPKGVHVRSHTSHSYIIEIRAVALAKMPGWKTLRTLADVCKAAGVAVSCRSLDQLCSAALAQAVQQMQLPGKGALPELNTEAGAPVGKAASPMTDTEILQSSLKTMPIKEEKPGQIADSAQDMVAPRSNLSTQQIVDQSEPSTPRHSTADSNASRRSGIGSLFKSAFRMSTSANPSRKYNSQLLDSSSSLGQMSSISQQQEPAKKGGIFGFKKKSKPPAPRGMMPSITEQSAGGLTEADISAFSQPIPDKFWSKMGRKMSSQRQGRPTAPTYKANIQNWFHEDDGTVSATGLGPAPRPKKSFEEQDLNELMYPAGNTPQEAPAVGAPRSAVNTRRQTTDSARPRLPQHGSAAFVLEEPIVATQRMVHAGPRRSFSFDDLDDMVNGGNRKARGHREDYASQMAHVPANHRQSHYGDRPAAFDQQLPRMHSGQRGFDQPQSSAHLMKSRSDSMPRRSFSAHDLDHMLRAPAAAPQQNMRQQQEWQNQAPKKRGPAIDPNSYGGYQGEPAPEWRPYKPASARTVPHAQGQQQARPHPQTEQRYETSHRQPEHHQMGRQGSGNLQQVRPVQQHAAQQQPQLPQQPHPQYHPSQQQQHRRPSTRQAAPHVAQQYQDMPRQVATQPAPRGQHVPQSFQQARPGPVPSGHPQHRPDRRSGPPTYVMPQQPSLPPDMAHLASLRALETGNIAVPKLPTAVPSTNRGTSLEQANSGGAEKDTGHGQENIASASNEVAYESTEQAAAEPAKAVPTKETEASMQQPAGTQQPAAPARPDPTAAVPSVLFQGVKIPKNATPPTRIARERDEVPEIRHSGSHEFSSPRP